MWLENIDLGNRQQSQQSDKHLVTNMNTNNSLALSQTFAQADIGKEQMNNLFIGTRQTLFTQKSEYDLPINSNKKERQQFHRSNSMTYHHHNNRKDVLLLITSIKMTAFLNQQQNDRRKYIENKQMNIKKMQFQIENLEYKIKSQKEMYLARFNKFKQRSDYLKKGKRSISLRLTTQIIDYKCRIGSIRTRSSINPTNCGTLNNTKQTRSKRHSQKYVRTERSQQRYMKIPYPQGYKNIIIQQIYPRTLPLMNGYRKQQHTNQFLRSGRPYYTIEQMFNPQFVQSLNKNPPNPQREANHQKENQIKQDNIFDILGKHFKIPATINSMESLAVQKGEEPNMQSMLKSSKSKKDDQQCISQKCPTQKDEKSQIIDEKTIKLLQQEEKKEKNSNPYSQTLSLSVSKKKSVRFATADFKIGNMGDSVQSQYTQTQRPFEARYKLRTSQKLQRQQKETYSVSQASSISSVSEDIIDSIKLSSHSRIYKEKLAQSKYLPSSDDPQNLVENSQLQDLDLLAVSNISKKRADNSKQIRKRLESIKDSIIKQ